MEEQRRQIIRNYLDAEGIKVDDAEADTWAVSEVTTSIQPELKLNHELTGLIRGNTWSQPKVKRSG
jgi:hypothetical protein